MIGTKKQGINRKRMPQLAKVKIREASGIQKIFESEERVAQFIESSYRTKRSNPHMCVESNVYASFVLNKGLAVKIPLVGNVEVYGRNESSARDFARNLRFNVGDLVEEINFSEGYGGKW